MARKRTLQLTLLAMVGAGMVMIGLARSGPTGTALALQTSATPAVTTEQKIATAMAAAPSSISKDATILDWEMDASGNPIVLHQGTNGWTCFPDLAATPSTDPMCLDQTWMAWAQGLATKTAPHVTSLGLAYMLEGGSDASNTDPFATAPQPGETWVNSPPHVMILMPGKLDQSVFGTDPLSGKPWIMWAGTPYEHIMMPVADRTGS